MQGDQSEDRGPAERWEANWREIQQLNLSDPHAAVARAEAWLAEEDAGGDPSGEGRALALRGLAYALRTAGSYERADQAFVEAEAAFARLGLGDDAARTKIGHVEALRYLGRYDEALRADEFAASEYRAIGARERLATVQMNLGLLHINRGEYGQALEVLLASRSLCEELGLDQKRAGVDLVRVRAYQALSLDAEAAEACEEAIETLRRYDLPFELANALLRNGEVAERRGELQQARQNLAEA